MLDVVWTACVVAILIYVALLILAWAFKKPSMLEKLAVLLLIAAGAMKGFERPTATFWLGGAALLLRGISRWRRRESAPVPHIAT